MPSDSFDPWLVPTESESGPIPFPPTEPTRPSLLRSTWRGARMGMLTASWVAAPIALVSLMIGLVLLAFGLGSGRGWGFHPTVVGAFRLLAGAVVLGSVVGAPLGLVGGLFGRSWPSDRRPRWLTRSGISIRPTPALRRRRRWPWLVGIPLGVLVLLMLMTALGVGNYLSRDVDHRLAAATAAADRDDPNWRLDDLMNHREAVPESENSSLVVNQALSGLPEGWPTGPWTAPGQPPSPLGSSWSRLTSLPDNTRLDALLAETFRGELTTYAEALGIARSVANYRRGRHELDLQPNPLDTLLPETQSCRVLARFLVADAAIRSEAGDPDGALDSCRAILGVARSIGDEPYTISQLVRRAIDGVALQATRRALGQGQPAEASLARLQQAILDESQYPELFFGLRGERATQYELIRRIGDRELPIDALGQSGKYQPGDPIPPIAPWEKLMFDSQRAVSLEWMNQAVAIAKRPIPEQRPLWDQWNTEVKRVQQSRFEKYGALLPALMAPSVSATITAQSSRVTELAATAILLAAERHRLKTGSWPVSVEAIDPLLLETPPLDPYTGRPFRLVHRDSRLTIYSLGPDLKDGQGAYDPRKWNRGGPDDFGATAFDVDRRRQPPAP